MKKSLNILLLLTVLTGCSTLEFWKSDDEQKVDGPRHAPALNNAGASSEMTPPMPPSMNTAGVQPMSPTPPPPPIGGSDDFMSNPALAQPQMSSVTVGSQAQQSTSGDRRAPAYNRQMLGQNASSGDLVAASPTPNVMQTALPQGDLTMPPPPAIPGKPDNTYPRLADIPPAPSVPVPAAQDARVAQMQQDLAAMQQQQANFQSSGNTVSIRGGAGGPAVQNQMPRPAGMASNQPTLVAQSPADPYLANAQTSQIPAPPPPPPEYTAMAQPQYVPHTTAAQPPTMQQQMPAPPQMPQQQANNQNFSQTTIMPKGPTIVVHSKNAPMQSYNPQLAMAAPPRPMPSYNPQSAMAAPTPPVMQQPLPPQQMAQVQPNSFPRVPSMQQGRSPSYLAQPMVQSQGQASTNLAQLHPIAVQPTQTYAAANDYPADGSTDSGGLQPIPTNNIKLLPASRYASMRSDSRDGTGN